jgi:hypothetical protein
VSPDAPEVSLAEAEERMGFPRDYLDFTIWYLKNKKYITKGDSSDLALTALGVDFVELNRSKIPILNRLLESGTGATRGPETARDCEDLDTSDSVLLPGPGEDAD